jgi:DNA-directed RNA polymerase subunit RPC12/RpoP
MGKALKVDYKNLKAEYKDGELKGIVKVENEENELVETEVNVTAEVKELLASLQDEETVSVNIKKYKEPKEKEKQPIFKYVCGCGKEIKSKFEGLDITCNECENTFMMEEGK